jgi:hypothetical protein
MMTVGLDQEARARLDAHLDAVEAALAGAGHTREQRRGVVDDLEAQVLDMLAARGESPALADVEAVLAQLDPPAAYAGGGAPGSVPVQPRRARYSRPVLWGLACILVSLLPFLASLFLAAVTGESVKRAVVPPEYVTTNRGEFMFLLGAGSFRTVVVRDRVDRVFVTGHRRNRSGQETAQIVGEFKETLRELQLLARSTDTSVEIISGPSRFGFSPVSSCLAMAALPLAILGTVSGWVGFAQIRKSGGALRGKGVALFDGLFYPVVLLLISVLLMA